MNTDINTNSIQKGMDVYDSTGDKIGSIAEVYRGSGTSDWGTGGTRAGDVVVEEVDVIETGPATLDTGTAGSASQYGTTPSGQFDTSAPATGAGMASSTSPAATATAMTGYFRVSEGGVLGIGATDLYIPFSAVTDVQPGDCVRLDCSKDDCNNLYSQKPSFLDQNS